MHPRSKSAARGGRRLARRLIPWALAGLPTLARASLLPPAMEEAMADFLGIAVLFIVPVVLIALFWIVHVMPEKIAEKNHHPQKHAIHTLCLLSLFFGGLLWPVAWLWAYTKPVGYKIAYGTDKHDDYFIEWGHKLLADENAPLHDLALLHDELDAMAEKGPLSSELQKLRESLVQRLDARRAAALAREKKREPRHDPGLPTLN
jgi:hypothetical protein